MYLIKMKLGLISLVLISATISNNLYAKQDKGKHRKPPQEAIDACVDKTEGDVVTFTTRRGDEISGTCVTMKEILIAVPDDHKNRKKPES